MVANAFMEIVKKVDGTPNIIVSDRDLPFSLVVLGPNYFLVWVLNWLIAHLIILNLMDKQRS